MDFLIVGFLTVAIGVAITVYCVKENRDDSWMGILVFTIGVCCFCYGLFAQRYDGHWVSSDKYEVHNLGERGNMLFYWYKGKEFHQYYPLAETGTSAMFKVGIQNVEIKIERDKFHHWEKTEFRLSMADSLLFKRDSTRKDSGDNVLILER